MKIEVSKIKKVAVNLILLFVLLFGFEARADFSLFDRSEIAKCRKLYNKKTQKDWDKAYESTCGELARNGNGEAQYYIGMMIKSSPKIPDYKAQAYSFFYVANENGEVRAKKEMEGMEQLMSKRDMEKFYYIAMNDYNSGTTNSNMVKKDDFKSFLFLEKSANLGNKFSQSSLSASFATGFFTNYKFTPDLIRAYKWSYLSVQDNIGFLPESIKDIKAEKHKAKKVFNKIKSMCNESQINEGDKLGKEWIKSHYDVIENLNKNNDSEILNSELLYNKPKK